MKGFAILLLTECFSYIGSYYYIYILSSIVVVDANTSESAYSYPISIINKYLRITNLVFVEGSLKNV